MFRDRAEAGIALAALLGEYRGVAGGLILAIPRGGVAVGAEIARALGLPLDVVGVRKIGAPGYPEFAVGAVDEDGRVLRNPSASVPDDYLRRQAALEHAEVARRLALYRGDRTAITLDGAAVVLVDDGIATGLTALAAIGLARDRGAASVTLATPVIAPDAARRLAASVDRLVAVRTPRDFGAVGAFYERFPQLTDEQVVALLEDARGSYWAGGA
ncbi:MAG: phosphoribosyltransferase family protein [Coriobacteriia bacterium]